MRIAGDQIKHHGFRVATPKRCRRLFKVIVTRDGCGVRSSLVDDECVGAQNGGRGSENEREQGETRAGEDEMGAELEDDAGAEKCKNSLK